MLVQRSSEARPWQLPHTHSLMCGVADTWKEFRALRPSCRGRHGENSTMPELVIPGRELAAHKPASQRPRKANSGLSYRHAHLLCQQKLPEHCFCVLGVSTSRRLMGARTGARRRCLLLPARAAQVSHVDHFYSRRRSEGVLTTPCGSQGCILGNMGRLVGWICYTRCEHGSSGFF